MVVGMVGLWSMGMCSFRGEEGLISFFIFQVMCTPEYIRGGHITPNKKTDRTHSCVSLLLPRVAFLHTGHPARPIGNTAEPRFCYRCQHECVETYNDGTYPPPPN